ncbi:hypothetical protein Q9L58_005248 [Maublancomyces gigas]|uniref:Translationally-controlled tumor protein homolog n=1 Tax=Discina gigas TaxID=1032678 RepID=A0ABR3GIQ5_9PEZI
MIIFKDVVTGDEMFSDAYEFSLIDDVVYEVDCKTVTIKKGADVDIGANASAEGGEEELEDGSITVNNIVYNFRLNDTQYDEKSYMKDLKPYVKKIKAHLESTGSTPEEIKKWEANMQKFAKKVLSKAMFPNWEFYIGESMALGGMVVLLNYREDGITPYMVFWKHGLKEEKV